MPINHTKISLLSFLLLITLVPATVWAQVYSGSLTGVIKDPSGAVVPGAEVKLTDVNKGYSLNVKSDESGRYLLRSIAPGTYRLSVVASGFRAYLQQGIVLDVGQNASIDIALQLGEQSNTLEVTSESTLLQTEDVVTGQTLNRTFVNDLPLIGRYVMDLVYLTPGITRPPGRGVGSEADGEGNNFVANGGRSSTNDVLIDGVSVNLFAQHGGATGQIDIPSLEAVQEFKIQSNFSADTTGFSGSTAVNMIIRSGTNSFHGVAFEFLRNNVLTANDWFNNRAGVKLPARRFNEFGANVGGPIRKDKTFFFANWEGFRNRKPNTLQAGVPSAAMRSGDFAEICAAGFDNAGMCNDPGGQLWDPYSGVFDPNQGGPVRSRFIPFNNMATYQSPGNPKLNGTPFQPPAVPGNLINPVASRMMQEYPLPNLNVGSPNYSRYNNWIRSVSDAGGRNQMDFKIDHIFGEKDRLSIRFAPRWTYYNKVNSFDSPMDPYSQGHNKYDAYSFALNHTHSFSPKTLLNVSLGYITNPVFGGNGVLPEFYPDYDISKELGVPEYLKISGALDTPAVVIPSYRASGGGTSIGNMPWGQYKQTPETYHLLVSVSRVQGRHDMKFGWEGRLHRISFSQPVAPAGVFGFDFNSTSQQPWSGGGDQMAGFLTGVSVPTGWGSEYEVPLRPATQSFQYGGFIQDNWRVTDKLTLNLGLRYDLSLSRTERHNRMQSIDPDVASPLQVPGLPNLRGGMVFASPDHRTVTGTDYNDFGPRFGFAYRLTEKTVLRGGYGVFYTVPRNAAIGNVGGGFQGFAQHTPWFTTFQNDGATPWASLSDPWPNGGPNLPIGSSQGLLSFIGDAVNGPIPSIHPTPYEQSWSFGIQREMAGGVLIDANYVGKKGTKLYYGGANEFNHLGPEVESYSADQIAALNTFVPNPFYGIITSGSLSGPEIQAYRLKLPYPQFTSFSIDELPAASSIYHSFQLKAEKRFARGLQFLLTYTLSKSIDDSSVQGLTNFYGGSSSLQDPNNRSLERSLSQFDSTHVLGINYTYELPVGRGKAFGTNWNAWLNGIIGGWKTNGIWQFVSGNPLGLGLADGQSLPTYGGQRPSLTGALERNTGPDFVDHYFANPEVVVKPAPYALGTAPRTLSSVRAPGINIANLSLFKEFPMSKIREGMRLEYRLEAFNAFNHPHFGVPDTNLNGGSFGQIFYLATSPREFQMGLKFYW
jgi:hypothetical protein